MSSVPLPTGDPSANSDHTEASLLKRPQQDSKRRADEYYERDYSARREQYRSLEAEEDDRASRANQ